MIQAMLLALLLTILVEGGVAMLLGYRRREEILAMVFINIITNLPFNYLLHLCSRLPWCRVDSSLIYVLEILIVLVEWRLLLFVLGKDSAKLLLLALSMNLGSYLTGWLLFGFR